MISWPAHVKGHMPQVLLPCCIPPGTITDKRLNRDASPQTTVVPQLSVIKRP